MLDDKKKNEIHMAILHKIMSDMGDEGMKRFDPESTDPMEAIHGVKDDFGASGPTEIPMHNAESMKPGSELVAEYEIPADEVGGHGIMEEEDDWGSHRLNKKMNKNKMRK